MIYVYEIDQCWIQLDAEDRGVLQGLVDYFTFEVPGAKHMPSVKAKRWDGKIRLVSPINLKTYRGLLPYIEKYCKDFKIGIEVEDALKHDESEYDADEFIKSIQPLSLEPFDYQISSFKHVIENKRCVLISPTSSGKSFITYLIVRELLDQDLQILITVPLTSLVTQLIQDFKDYSPNFPIEDYCHCVYEGAKKETDRPVTISTWQSVYKQSKEYFKDFDAVIVDEAHGCSAQSLKGICEKAINAEYRVGLTGTLQDTKAHRLVIEGLLGPALKVTDTDTLTKKGVVSKLSITCAILSYSDEIRFQNKNLKFQDEMKFIKTYQKRLKVISNLAKACEGNTLILSAYTEHIDQLKEYFKDDPNCYIVTGAMKTEEREKVRKIAEKTDNVTIIATYGVFSTGINIRNLQNVIFATSSKSQIRVLQSIGRGLRKDGKNNKLKLIDIVDDFSYKKRKNYLVRHFFERIKIYESQKFQYKIFNIKI